MEKEKGKKSLTVGIDRNPYRDNVDLFDTDEIALEPGVTVLCGCNGSGKTTLLGEIAKGLGYRPGGERMDRLRKAVETIGGGASGGPDDGKGDTETESESDGKWHMPTNPRKRRALVQTGYTAGGLAAGIVVAGVVAMIARAARRRRR